MEIMELPIEFEFNGHKNHINPSLIISKNELTLVDTGYPNFLPFIENEISKNGYDMKNLKNIILPESLFIPVQEGRTPHSPYSGLPAAK
jgi:glyoxylase-like metal-dependent hydrolase (beta-lactamase superfamily II)